MIEKHLGEVTTTEREAAELVARAEGHGTASDSSDLSEVPVAY